MPYTIYEIEVTQTLPSLVFPEGDTGIALIVRWKGRPIGFLMKELPARSILSSKDLSQLISDGVKPQLIEEKQWEEPEDPNILDLFPSLTVAICTKNNPQDLANCLTQLLRLQRADSEGAFEILVIVMLPPMIRQINSSLLFLE